MKEKIEVVKKKGDLFQRVNSLMVSLGRGSDTAAKKAFDAQCAHFYGAPAWDFSDRAVAEFRTMWNRCVRRVLRLPYATHTRFLPLIKDISSASNQVYSQFLKMHNKMEISDNEWVRYLTCCSMASPRSIIGTNLNIIGRRLHLNQSSSKAKGIGLLKNIYILENAWRMISEH